MKKLTRKIGCAVMSAAMVFSLNFSGLSIQKVEASGEYVVNKSSGDAYTAIQSCLDKAKDSNGGTVKVPAGTYEISDVLRIYSNTTLQLDKNATIKRAAGNEKIMIVNGAYDDRLKGGYSKNTGITITGGTWDGSNGSSAASENGSNNLYFGHASNITIKDTTIKNCYGEHLLELTAVKDSTVDNVTFDNFIGKYNEENAYKEALQLDYTDEITSEAFPPFDKTACQNITITSCSFKNYPAGVGSHSIGINKHTNVEISSCSFENITNVCVDAQNYFNIKVNNNKQMGKNPVSFMKIDKTSGSCSGNIVSGAEKYGLWIGEDSDVLCSNDSISNVKDIGIDVSGSSKVTLSAEKISDCNNYGANINNSIVVIKDSQIKNSSKSAINAANSYVGISNNVLTNGGENGIYISNPSDLSYADNNEITTASYSGISIEGGKKGISLEKNTLYDTGKYGILVCGSNDVSINKNDISKFSRYGIYIRESGTGSRSSNVKVSGNKVNGGPSGIVIMKTDKAEISGNTTSAINNYDIFVENDCRNTTVKNNKYAVEILVHDTSASVSGNAQQKTTSEIKKINGKWVYANGNTVVTSYTGLAKYGGSWWYIKNGYLDFGYTGLYYYNGTWWYVQSGKINFGYSGLCKYNGNWWYITGGQVNFKYTGLYKYNGNWWYIHGGRIEFESSTLVQYNRTWWYVSGGYVRFGATGLCKYNGKFWYVQNGRVNFNAVTVVKYNGTWWYVSGGYVRFDAQGLCKYAGTWWYIRDGRINFNYKGLVKYNGTWWYVSGGKIDWNYSGTTTYNGKTYRVSGGRLS